MMRFLTRGAKGSDRPQSPGHGKELLGGMIGVAAPAPAGVERAAKGVLAKHGRLCGPHVEAMPHIQPLPSGPLGHLLGLGWCLRAAL